MIFLWLVAFASLGLGSGLSAVPDISGAPGTMTTAPVRADGDEEEEGGEEDRTGEEGEVDSVAEAANRHPPEALVYWPRSHLLKAWPALPARSPPHVDLEPEVKPPRA